MADFTCKLSATEINSYLEGDCDLESIHETLDRVITTLKESGDKEAKILITVENDLEDEDEEEESE